MELTNPCTAFPPIKLLLEATTIREQAFTLTKDGQRLHFPSYVTLSAKEDILNINVTLRHHLEDYWDADDGQHAIETISLPCNTLLRLVIDQWWPPDHDDPWPAANLHVRDPLDLVESFSITFASTDRNNPQYWIKAFVRLAKDTLGIPVLSPAPPSTKRSSAPSDDEVPF